MSHGGTQPLLMIGTPVGLLLLLACGRISLGSRDIAADAGNEARPVRDGGLEPALGDGGVPPGSSERDGGSLVVEPAVPSCRAAPRCRAGAVSCCETSAVPDGDFDFGLRAAMGTASRVTVATFDLDVFEVTVRRFREFVADYDAWRASGNPMEGAGATGTGTGWQSAWSDLLPANSALLRQGVIRCDDSGPYSSWDAPSDSAPMNCVSWFEAFAFCAWDGGRLPTEPEWEYAAAGGAEQRLYPWGNTPEPESSLALFGCDINTGCALSDLSAVGSHHPGAARWGHEDLAGSLSEWLFDPLDAPLDARAFRGGSWGEDASALRIGARNWLPPEVRIFIQGFRCARDRT
jgi:formylglycine-generating enzyme required for sulfatase activity